MILWLPLKATNMKHNLDAYLSALTPEQNRKMQDMMLLIRQLVPQGTIEKMAYGMPSWHLQTYLLHLGAFKNHFGLYPGPDAIQACKKWVGNYACSKGGIQIPWKEPIPTTLIRELIAYNLLNHHAKINN